jgi:hypothetical protein
VDVPAVVHEPLQRVEGLGAIADAADFRQARRSVYHASDNGYLHIHPFSVVMDRDLLPAVAVMVGIGAVLVIWGLFAPNTMCGVHVGDVCQPYSTDFPAPWFLDYFISDIIALVGAILIVAGALVAKYW